MTANEAIAQFALTNTATPEMQAAMFEAGYLDYDHISGKYGLSESGKRTFRMFKIMGSLPEDGR